MIETVGRALTEEDYDVLREDIRNEFDYYTEENLKRSFKKAGVVAGIGISIIAVITGLALGLKRKGKDVVADNERKGNDNKEDDVWTWIEDAGGETLVMIGDNLYIILGGLLVLAAYRRRHV